MINKTRIFIKILNCKLYNKNYKGRGFFIMTFKTFDTKVISGFPGVGKTKFIGMSQLYVLDSDSSNFSWASKGVRNPDFPKNYIDHIKAHIGLVDIILVSSHDIVREALESNGIKYYLVYPDKSLKKEYIQRYIERGNDENFINFITTNWDGFIDKIESDTYPTKIKLSSGKFLSDLLAGHSG